LRRAILALVLAGCAGAAPAASRDVDLLKLIEPARDSVIGTWKFDGAALVSPNAKFGRMQILYAPPEEYSVTLVAERTEGANSIVLGLVSGGHPFMVAVDAAVGDPPEPMSGMELIDGKSFGDNETLLKGRLLQNSNPATVVVHVRRGRIGATLNGKKIVDWEGEADRLSLHTKWKMRRADALWIGAFTSVWRVHALTLTPVTGEGRILSS
jgi:hypothetical protein